MRLKIILYTTVVVFVSTSAITGLCDNHAGSGLSGPELKHKHRAVCIGINTYEDTTLRPLQNASNDAHGVSAVLNKQGQFAVYTFSDRRDRNTTFPDSNRQHPSKNNIESFFSNRDVFDNVAPDDLMVVFFSGHGINDSNGSGYLLPSDWKRDKPFSSAVAISFITDRLKELGISRSLIILDTCRNVMVDSKSPENLAWLSGEKFDTDTVSAVFYSTNVNGYSFEDPHTEYGAFSRFIIYGLQGRGDINSDKRVTIGELSTYVRDSLISWALENGFSQRPYIRLMNEKCENITLTMVPEQ
ncbi:caspase domain-containing protein [Candidatus Latescibacterota bacterium]